MKSSKILLKTHCKGCGRPTVIVRTTKKCLECNVCKTLGVERSRAEWLNLNKHNSKTQIMGVPHGQQTISDSSKIH